RLCLSKASFGRFSQPAAPPVPWSIGAKFFCLLLQRLAKVETLPAAEQWPLLVKTGLLGTSKRSPATFHPAGTSFSGKAGDTEDEKPEHDETK
ncbi:MAG: hypothetical protein E6X17_15440, partial [Sporomusaceae bacterium]|nr:hypothetical protein [Sporomusaceae bacterium]